MYPFFGMRPFKRLLNSSSKRTSMNITETMSEVVIYQTSDSQIQVEVKFDQDTVWTSRQQLSDLFDRDIKTIGKHINNVFKEGELDKSSVVAKFATTATDGKTYQVEYYNLDVIISVGYRVKSQRGTQFRQWATQRLKEYLVQGYAINQKRLAEKEMEVQHLKSGIHILRRTIEHKDHSQDEVKGLATLLDDFSQGLTLLDDYDHEQLDEKGNSQKEAVFIGYEEFMTLIEAMRTLSSDVFFGKEKDESFKSSTTQIYQSFAGQDLYPSLEEKAAMLLYFIGKNHSFVDGNKRIAAACFLYFLEKNSLLYNTKGEAMLSNDTLASLTLFIAESKPEEMETVKQLIISILNRKKR